MTVESTRQVAIRINQIPFVTEVAPETLLVHHLRQLGFTGTRVGCETSACGACTVIVDGSAVKSCTMFAVQAEGTDVTTVEGLGDSGGGLHPLATAFLDHQGLQCGFCTSGMLMSAAALLDRSADPSADEVRSALEGNLCRCTGYETIVRAVLAAAAERRGAPADAPPTVVRRADGGYLSRGE